MALFKTLIRWYLRLFKERPAEACAFSFVILAALVTYVNGVFIVLPYVISEQNLFVHFVSHVAAIWCFLGVWVNMYMIQTKSSSILGRVLEPVIVTGSEGFSNNQHVTESNGTNFGGHYEGEELRERQQTEQIKAIGQQFMRNPFGSETAWHICGSCETYVPPRCWHCYKCRTCILRRDHHCIFTACCIGEDNQIHFLGMLLYLAIGTCYSTLMSMSYCYHYYGTPYWMYCVKALVSAYVMIFDFSMMGIISSLTFVGGAVSAAMFVYYLYLALQGKTVADHSRKIERIAPGQPKFSYQALELFLGPNPIFLILWPFASSNKNGYNLVRDRDKSEFNSTKFV